MANNEIDDLKRQRAKWELKIKLLKLIGEYKSNEEPDIKLTKDDVINVLSSMIARKTE